MQHGSAGYCDRQSNGQAAHDREAGLNTRLDDDAQPSTEPRSKLKAPLGIHVDGNGCVRACEGLSAASEAPVIRLLGRVRMDKRCSPNRGDLRQLYDEYLTCSNAVVVASMATSFDVLTAYRQVHGPRWKSTTVALATEFVCKVLKPAGRDDESFFVLNHEGQRVELSYVYWADGVLEVSDCCMATIELHEDPPALLRRCLRRFLACLREAGTTTLVYQSDDAGITQKIELAYDALRADSRFPDLKTTFTFIRRTRDAIAVGAALHSLSLCNRADVPLILDIWPFDFEISFGDHRLNLLCSGTTIPTTNSETICLRKGDDLAVGISSYDERGLMQRYVIPIEEAQLQRLQATSEPLSVTVNVGATNSLNVIVQSGSWQQAFLPGDLTPAPRIASEPSDPRQSAEGTQDGDTVVPEGLRELIATLDDVDMGVRALSEDDLRTPVGKGVVAVQKRLLQAIEALGAEHYPALGATFDPYLHEAMGSVVDDTLPRDYVMDEVRRGYRYQGRVIRYSLVRVANPT